MSQNLEEALHFRVETRILASCLLFVLRNKAKTLRSCFFIISLRKDEIETKKKKIHVFLLSLKMAFNEKLTLLVIAYYDLVSDSKIGCNELFHNAQLLKNQFTDEDYIHLKQILVQDSAQITLSSGSVIVVKQDYVYGLRTKRTPCLIKEVDINTFEMALDFYAASSQNYKDVHKLYDEVQALRLEVQRLQTELGMLTFDVMREDIL